MTEIREAPAEGPAPPAAIRDSAATDPVRRLPAKAFYPLAFAITLLTWRSHEYLPERGLDPSWQAALHVAGLDRMLKFGSDLVFTYGPLGFLAVPLLTFGDTFILSIVYTATVQLAFCAVTLRTLTRRLPLALAVPIVFIAARTASWVGVPEAAALTVAVYGIEAAAGDLSPRARRLLPLVLGPVVGVQALVKLNAGLLTAAVAAVLVLGSAKRPIRALATMGGCAAVVATGGWLVTGNALTDIPAFLRLSVEIVSGYSSAMGVEDYTAWWEYFAALAAALVLGGLVVWATRRWTWRPRAAVALAIAGTLFASFKWGFVRHEMAHGVGYFVPVTLLALACVMAGRGRIRSLVWPAALFVVFLIVSQSAVRFLFTPHRSVHVAVEQAAMIVSKPLRTETMESAKDLMLAIYGIDDHTWKLLDGRTVHVDPWETSIVWATRGLFRWRPLPVFQTYSAYTSELDQANARMLASERAPEMILRESPRSIDGRNPDFETPETVLQMLCRYRELRTTARWQVLARGPDRCGTPRTIGTRTTLTGVAVPVPDAGPREAVFVRVRGVHTARDALRSFAFKAPKVFVKSGDGQIYRVPPELASGPLLLRLPSFADYPAPAHFGARFDGLRIEIGEGVQGGREVDLEFIAVPFMKPGPAAAADDILVGSWALPPPIYVVDERQGREPAPVTAR